MGREYQTLRWNCVTSCPIICALFVRVTNNLISKRESSPNLPANPWLIALHSRALVARAFRHGSRAKRDETYRMRTGERGDHGEEKRAREREEKEKERTENEKRRRRRRKRNDESSQLVTVYQAVAGVSRSRNRLVSADRNTGCPYEARFNRLSRRHVIIRP